MYKCIYEAYIYNLVYISTSINIKSDIYIQFVCVCVCVCYTERDKVRKRENDCVDRKLFLMTEIK